MMLYLMRLYPPFLLFALSWLMLISKSKIKINEQKDLQDKALTVVHPWIKHHQLRIDFLLRHRIHRLENNAREIFG